MRLTGEQVAALCDAVRACVSDGRQLRQVVREALDVRLDDVVGPGGLDNTVFELVEWLEARDRVGEFLAALRDRFPRRLELADLLAEIDRPRPPVCDLPLWKDAVVVTDGWLEAYAAPDAIYEVVRMRLEAARTSILIGMYEFTAPHLKDLLVAARARGVQVTLLLGSRQFSQQKPDVIPDLVKAGVVVIDAPARARGRFFPTYHAKLVVIDRTWTLLQSVNFSTSGVPLNGDGNRGAGVTVQSAELAEFFADMLEKDMRLARQVGETGAEKKGEDEPHYRTAIPVPRFAPFRVKGDRSARREGGPDGPPAGTRVLPVLTPDNYMEVVPHVLAAARESIDIQQQYIRVRGPKLMAILDAVKQARARNPNLVVRVIISGFFDVRQLLEELLMNTSDWLRPSDVRLLGPRSGMHCMNKLVVVDRQVCLLGSANWSEMGVSANRDTSLLIDSAEVADYFSRVFQLDWDLCAPPRRPRAQPTRTPPAGSRTPRGKNKK